MPNRGTLTHNLLAASFRVVNGEAHAKQSVHKDKNEATKRHLARKRRKFVVK